jgi:hypothetical protein
MPTYKITSTDNTIIADQAFMDAQYAGEYTLVPEVAAPVPVDPCEWLIDHMPLLERFGPQIKHLFLKSTDPDVVALRMDYFARKWLDMGNPELSGGFYFMAGVTVPILGTIATPIVGLTPALVAEKFAIPAARTENSALRAQFFS